MPNVSNYLLVEGEESSLLQFLELIKTPNPLFRYNSQVLNVSPTSATVSFSTERSIPEQPLITISSQFPNLDFTNQWIEEPFKFAGIFFFKAGQRPINESESDLRWKQKKSEYIHRLSLKYKKEQYLEFLKAGAEREGQDSPFFFYLSEASLAS